MLKLFKTLLLVMVGIGPMSFAQTRYIGKSQELQEQIDRPRYEYQIIDELNTLMLNTKGTTQHDIIQQRLQAFYIMNKNIKL